jgi:hypothetical protein
MVYGQGKYMGKPKKHKTFELENLMGRAHMEDPTSDQKIISKQIFNKQVVRMKAGFSKLKTGPTNDHS